MYSFVKGHSDKANMPIIISKESERILLWESSTQIEYRVVL